MSANLENSGVATGLEKISFQKILKKGNAKECSNYLTIALISHTSKVMLKILQARLQQYLNHELPDVQDGFRKGRGTTDQIDNICWIIEKAREFHKNFYFCLIDYDKAFDCLDHNKLWNILKEIGLPDHLTCLLRNLYAGQEATVRTGHGKTDWFQIGKEVCQGYILSPCLFNLCAMYIMRNMGLEEAQAGIRIVGRNINNFRYTDDTTLMAESEEELKSFLMKVKEKSEKKIGWKLNIQKTKNMASSPITSWQIDGEKVADLILGGLQNTADGHCSYEIKRHLLLWRKVMTNLGSILKSRDITLSTKTHLVKAIVFPVVMSGCEGCTIKKAECQELMLLNCGVGEDSWESLGLQGDPISPSLRRSVLGVHWKDWCWSWNSNTLATWWKELTYLKRPRCWEWLRAGGEGDDRRWDSWMASLTQWIWVWVGSGSWWWTGRPGVLWLMESQRVAHNWVKELNWPEHKIVIITGRLNSLL